MKVVCIRSVRTLRAATSWITALLVHFDLSNSCFNPASAHYTFMSLFSARLFMTTVTSQLCFYFEPGDILVVTSEHVLCCGGLMGCNHCKWANLTNLRRCPRIPVAAFNHLPELGWLSDCQVLAWVLSLACHISVKVLPTAVFTGFKERLSDWAAESMKPVSGKWSPW